MPRAAGDSPGPVHGVRQPTPSRASVSSRTVRAGPRLPRSMALITAALGSGRQHPVRLAREPGVARGPGGAGRGAGAPDRPARMSAGAKSRAAWPRPGEGGAGAGLRPGHAGPAGAVVSPRPPSPTAPARLGHKMAEGCGGHFVEPSADKGRWGTKAAGSQGGDASQSGSTELPLRKRGLLPCAELREGPAGERGEQGVFWNLPPAQAPSCPGCQRPPSPPSRGSGWYWHLLCPGQWHRRFPTSCGRWPNSGH